jgi:hypothetical protein
MPALDNPKIANNIDFRKSTEIPDDSRDSSGDHRFSSFIAPVELLSSVTTVIFFTCSNIDCGLSLDRQCFMGLSTYH